MAGKSYPGAMDLLGREQGVTEAPEVILALDDCGLNCREGQQRQHRERSESQPS